MECMMVAMERRRACMVLPRKSDSNELGVGFFDPQYGIFRIEEYQKDES